MRVRNARRRRAPGGLKRTPSVSFLCFFSRDRFRPAQHVRQTDLRGGIFRLTNDLTGGSRVISLGIILGRARIQSEGVDREIVRRTRVPRADTNLELQTETFVGPLSVGLPVVSEFFLPGTVSRAGLLACTSSGRGEGSRDTTYAAGAVRAPTHARERARGALGRSSRARSFTPVRSRRDLALSGRGPVSYTHLTLPTKA